jgi:methylenetetrahydrofolate reductase (NADPH)
MESRERKKGLHRHHGLEHLGKTVLYGCMDCGDCGLEAAIYTCPMTQCPKCQRNGPCGGSTEGWCEVYPDERYCIYFKAYHRLKKYDELYKLDSFITPPNNWDFYETSGWSNYTHQRDNAARRIYLPPQEERARQ